MKLFGLKNCDTCRKALKALQEAGHQPGFHDVRADGVGHEDLGKWAAAAGWEKLLNTRSTTWRSLATPRKENLDAAKAMALMAEYPTLIKRPVIEADGAVYVGWGPATQAALLG